MKSRGFPLCPSPVVYPSQRPGPRKRTLSAFFALLLNLAAVSVKAQNPAGPPPGAQQPPQAPGEVRGSIVAADSTGLAVARPAVAVRSKADGKLVTGAYGADDGTFRIQGLRPGTYYLRVSGVGFTPLNTPEFTIDPAAPTAISARTNLPAFRVRCKPCRLPAGSPPETTSPIATPYK